jgi:hypothetical protein
MPRVEDGGSIDPPVWTVRPRKDGNYRAYKDGVYWGTTGQKTEAGALNWLEMRRLQQEAEEDGVFDVRRVPVATVIEERKNEVVKRDLKGAGVIVSTLKAIEPHMKDLQLRHLKNDRMDAIGTAMVAKGYVHEYYCNAARYLATAIRKYTKKEHGVAFLPYDPPRCGTGRETVVSKAQRDRVKLAFAAARAPDSGLSAKERRDAEVAYMELHLGMTFGSRPGAYHKLAWEEHDEGGWLDLDAGVFHRVPLGKRTPGNKLAPEVEIPPEVLPELRRWKEAAGGSKWVFRTLKGGPLSQSQQEKIFKAQMLALGLEKVTGHVLRHTCISNMISKGASAPSISAVCGISIAMLYKRYGHFENRAVQRLAHGVMASMMD